MMLVTIPFPDGSGSTGSRSGYTSMVLAFLVIFFGVRTYRTRGRRHRSLRARSRSER
jgi:hypothetical protein